MVEGTRATFYKEGWSMTYASSETALIGYKTATLGCSNYFIDLKSNCYILDDHYFINTYRSISVVVIIDHQLRTGKAFKPYHHAHADNMEQVDKETLKAVGETVLHVIKGFTDSGIGLIHSFHIVLIQ